MSTATAGRPRAPGLGDPVRRLHRPHCLSTRVSRRTAGRAPCSAHAAWVCPHASTAGPRRSADAVRTHPDWRYAPPPSECRPSRGCRQEPPRHWCRHPTREPARQGPRRPPRRRPCRRDAPLPAARGFRRMPRRAPPTLPSPPRAPVRAPKASAVRPVRRSHRQGAAAVPGLRRRDGWGRAATCPPPSLPQPPPRLLCVPTVGPAGPGRLRGRPLSRLSTLSRPVRTDCAGRWRRR